MTDLIEKLQAATGVERAHIEAVIDLLDNFPADGRPQDFEAQTNAHAIGFIELHSVKERCPTCGTPKEGHAFFKRTVAGKLFLASIKAQEQSNG